MVDILEQQLEIGDLVLVSISGPKLVLGRIKSFYNEDTEYRKIETCLVILPSKIEVMKFKKQVYKINGSTETTTTRENDTEVI